MVRVTEGKITANEIQGKSTLVRVSARLELARVRVIGSLKQITGSKEISKWTGRECN